MKKILLQFCSCAVIVFSCRTAVAQQFTLGELSVIKPAQVIVENYVTLILAKEIIDDAMANQFDKNNPYTYLQIINDPKTTDIT